MTDRVAELEREAARLRETARQAVAERDSLLFSAAGLTRDALHSELEQAQARLRWCAARIGKLEAALRAVGERAESVLEETEVKP